jgi:uncharacterized DUF497 family protein
VKITFDPKKREATVRDRKVDFTDAPEVFAGPTIDQVDQRRNYGETRIITAGLLKGRMVIVVWTQREDARHIISMRKANDREKARYGNRFEEAG